MVFDSPIVLGGFGACTSVGLSAAESCNAVLSGVSRIARQKRYPYARRGDAIALAKQDCLRENTTCASRMTELARRALEDLLSLHHDILGADGRTSATAIPVLLSLPTERPGLSQADIASVAGEISKSVPQFCRSRSRFFCGGHTGFIAGLAKSADLLKAGEVDFCIVGGVDSPLDMDYLHWLDDTDRLKHQDNPFGIVPGEGAAFALVLRDSGRASEQGAPRVVLRAVGHAAETMPWYTDQATRGDGLTAAIAQCLPADVQVDNCYGDLTGETWRSAEWDFAFLRNGRQFAHPLDICHPADIWGDTGAASSAMLCMLAHDELTDIVTQRRYSLIFSASDTRLSRAACLLERIDFNDGISSWHPR
ncbi:hypothetical protein [Burkholderia ubonensis]|uniref:hypothetical protein n=1 Tax=Burkholderia ubonensis TaxID=101571 RepID=UPI000AD532F4|nr:hypothetical protein [Burkholderia ubonensis]